MSHKCLPPELLTKIFKECFSKQTQFGPTAVPLLVIQVCRFWRVVALSDPSIWNTLNIFISLKTPSRSSSAMLDAAKLWLSRSATQPLSISITLDNFLPIPYPLLQLACQVLTLLDAHSDRLQSLSMILPGCPMLFDKLFSQSMPMLQMLHLALNNWRLSDLKYINKLLECSPSLQSFSWNNRASWSSWDDAFVSGIDELQVPWNNITHLTLDCWMTLQSSYTILQQCRRIIRCKLLRFGGGFLDDHTSASHYNLQFMSVQPKIILQHLLSFDVYCAELNDGLALLFDLLFCPQLREFSSTCGYIKRIRWPQLAFGAFIERSACQIHSLMFEFTKIPEDDLTRCLELCSSSLTCLKLYDTQYDYCISDTLLSLLDCSAASSVTTVLCPNLTSLVVHNAVQCTNGGVAAMLRSRTHQSLNYGNIRCCPLENIDIKISPRANPLDFAYVQRLRDGIVVI